MKKSERFDRMIPYGRQDINSEDINAVVAVLESDFLTQGPAVPRFERAVADYCGARESVAANSATSALHLACLSLGVVPGDLVWTSPITFVASANCALYCGAKVDFVDIDSATYNMSVSALEEKLVEAERLGCLPKVVIPVHMCGQSCDMEGIHALACRYGFRIIEDASHAIGGKYKGLPIGGCIFSDITVFSFHPVKIITTGEGGMALTNDEVLAAKMRLLRSHGITRDQSEMLSPPDGPWFYQQLDLGFNYRMTEMQAALGISQLGRLDQFVSIRHERAQSYNELLSAEGIGGLPWQSPDVYSSYHLYVLQLEFSDFNVTQREFFEHLRSDGVFVNLHYIPVYRHPYFRSRGHGQTLLPQAESYYAKAVTLPIYPGLKVGQQREIVRKMKVLLGLRGRSRGLC